MKNYSLYFLFIITALVSCKNEARENETIKKDVQKDTAEMVFTSDVDNFWVAYDKIRAEQDTAKHLQILKEEFLNKGTQGLTDIMEARRYKPYEYVNAINNYSELFNSIRTNTLTANNLGNEIENGIEKLKKIYPDLKPAKVFFTIGVFRTGGTTMNGNVLIGVETAFGDKHSNVSELPEKLNNIKTYWSGKDKPTENFAIGNVHEYIHTQQHQDINSNLLGISILEGVAELVSMLAMEQEKPHESALLYGLKNDARLKEAFKKDMFKKDYGFWIWDNSDNPFDNQRDLAYYMGYAMAKKYYDKSKDKKAAIKEMIELDHFDTDAINAFVNKTGYFSESIEALKSKYPTQK